MRVIGTAGHVDHGKSTLVQALTGIDPDRLQEEKARGMTIDLGFAWLDLPRPDGTVESVGIVDVPGHIDFIKNMLAGVGGIDAALLVVAADEGVMPQTREHLAILDLLAVPAAVVALTKSDLIDDPEWLELVELDVAELLASTHLAGAPIVPVSAVTGAGLEELKRVLATALTDLPPRRNRGRPRLPIDRVFTLSGFGTIVTGTLLDGELNVGDTVEILPTQRTARIRSLQTHRRPVQTARPGSRVAINLTGVGADALQRGDVVVHPNTLIPTTLIDVRFRLLADGPRPLKHNQAVDFFVGAAEIPAVVRLLGTETLAPGEEGWLQLRLARPAVVTAGDRFILRQPSPSQTLGGGVIVNPSPQRRWRRFDPRILAQLQTLAHGQPDEILLQTLERLRLTTPKTLLASAELDTATAAAALDTLRRQQALIEIGAGEETILVSLSAWRQLVDSLVARVAEHHRQFPLRRGLLRSEARSRLQALLPGVTLTVRAANAVIDVLVQQGLLHADDTFVRLPDFTPTPTPAQQQCIERVLAAFSSAPYAPPNLQDTLQMLEENTELLDYLIEQGILVRLGGDVLLRVEDFSAMVQEITAHLRAQGTITLAEVRDRFQTSRKYAQAVLEEMDARRITRREGDVRVLR
ncbi:MULTISPECIES: selenocysteine-specific translation elongation factor [Caldilinea]|uniref:Selenocysteine-specific elongation factor n=1 Tax=Caldilinea aerophila (strain DSM 14535 / JCM 11387 / NBRC 104270 / STL-6-O1) TaxID=926550 RepID=I0I6Z7_CALAS|nr:MULTISPECIES: selenocysteine-specific translation elongation factor [Caldilinea]BAM01035.1 selenocysteine-specific elongation factor [Caldilinea aerophila DSM 14535 = NBRC 104270]GIV72373.1 MAG: selenocysteine-specific translation factor [Caldilinea sp.]